MEAIYFEKNVKTHTDCVFGNDGRNLTEILQNENLPSGDNLPVIYPEDFSGDTIAEKVEKANAFMLLSGGGFELRFEKSQEYLINKAIIIPSNTVIRATDCIIRLADYTVDNIFRTANIIPDDNNPKGFAVNKDTMPETIRNIKLIGNNAELVQCTNATEYGASTVGWRGTLSHLVAVENFEVTGWKVTKNLSWCFAFYGVKNGSIHDIEYHTGRETGDGCDFCDAHNVQIYNLYGTTQDDTVSLGDFSSERLNVRPAENNIPIIPFDYDLKPFGGGCDDIFVKSIHTNGTNHVLILITGTYQLKNITASDLSDKYDGIARKNAIIKVYGGQYNGDYNYNLIHNCCIDNIEAYNPAKAAVWLSEGLIKDGIINNVRVTSGKIGLSNESGADIANYNMQVVIGDDLT